MDIFFLGMNEAGEEVLEWLEQKEELNVREVIADKEGLAKIKQIRPELVVSSGYEYIVPKEVINIPEKGIVNLHPSYLPYNRGAHPYIWPLIDGSPAGVSVHFMNENLDEGPVIARKKVEKNPDDNAKTLRDRLMKEQVQLFKDSWDKVLKQECFEQDLEKGNAHYKSDLDQIADLDLDREMSLREAIDLLRGLKFGERSLAYFEDEENAFSVDLSIVKE